MRRLLSSVLILSLAACASTPTPAVQTTPPPPTATEPTLVAVESTDAGAPTVASPEVADAAVVGATVTPTTTTPTTTTPTTTTPTTATPTTATPTTTTPPTPAVGNAVAQGRVAFLRVCGRCHEDGDADGPTPNKRWAEARMRTLIRSGNARMRAIPLTRLTDADLALVVSYLRSTHAIQ